ncbi:MAG: NUDIX domain-containing protein, partial [Atribacterota bacterium]|nr:NUDIX domain-containing protein [Atribacterota bacterium]
EIYDCDIDKKSEIKLDEFYQIRKASRAIVFNDSGEIALLYVSKNLYHKLPGGGIENSESIVDALKREILEEIGCNVSIIGELGIIIECKNEHKKIQFSYCYVCKKEGASINTSHTESEISEGFKLVWLKIGSAIEILEKDIPLDYTGKFIKERDLTFLKYIKNEMNNGKYNII